jgi:hypothetical protein
MNHPTVPQRRQPATAASSATGAGALQDMERVYADTHVVKRLSASQPGALKLARRYGDALVCVRYRHDRSGRHRYTTVELVVDDAPVAPRACLDDIVAVKLNFGDTAVRQRALAHGATWNGELRLWFMPRRLARKLGLVARIVET